METKLKDLDELRDFASTNACNMYWLDDHVLSLSPSGRYGAAESWIWRSPADKYERLDERVDPVLDFSKMLKEPWC